MRARLRRVAAGIVAVGATAGLVGAATAAPAAGDQQAVRVEAVFNTPDDAGNPSTVLEDRLLRLINETPAGEEIGFSAYTWTRTALARALSDAKARGVRVRLAMNGTADNPDNAATQILKNAGFDQLVFCKGRANPDGSACIADRPGSINHNKLFTFSKTGDLSDVVMVSSANLTAPQLHLFNNAVIVSGDAELYDYYQRHLGNMLAQRKNNDYFNSPDGTNVAEASNVITNMSPRAASDDGTGEDGATDTYGGRLRLITRYEPGCKLDVVHMHMSDERTSVYKHLARIGQLGCQVRIVYKTMGSDAYQLLSSAPNVSLKRYVSIHSKYMAYTGNYDDTAATKLVLTGSHNLSGAALRKYDEILIRVVRADVTDAFHVNFATIWSRAK